MRGGILGMETAVGRNVFLARDGMKNVSAFNETLLGYLLSRLSVMKLADRNVLIAEL